MNPRDVLDSILHDCPEAETARLALELSNELHDGEEAVSKLALIEEILDEVIARIPTTDPEVPWNALLAIRKVTR